MNIDTAFIIVRMEIERTISKHPIWPKLPVHQAAIVCEESGELIREALHLEHEGCGDEKRFIEEAVQTAAVSIRLIMGK